MSGGKKFIILGILLVILIAIPLTVYILQQQQETRSRATAATTLSLCKQGTTTNCTSEMPIRTNVDQTFDLDVVINPGSNKVVGTVINIAYDSTKVTTSSAGTTFCGESFCPTPALNVVSGPIYTPGNIAITLHIGVDATKIIQTTTKLATVRFKALAETGPTGTDITFSTQTSVGAPPEGAGAEPESNVLNSKEEAKVVIGAGTNPTTTPTIAPTVAPPAPTATPPAALNKAPTCISLNVDRGTSGTAPFSLTFTANGNDSDGKITKATFDFGDGPLQDLTQGLDSPSVSAQVAHTYRNAGTYKATVTFTDNNNAISTASVSCSQAMTIAQAAIGAPVPTSGSAVVTIPPPPQVVSSPVPTSRPTPITTIAATGPGDTIIGIGALGAVLSIIGAVIFFAL